MEELRAFYRAFREYKEKLGGDGAHDALVRALEADANAQESFADRLGRCVWDEAWIDAMFAGLPYVERALEEQRRFIESNAEIRRIDQAKRVTVESVRHLAQHSNFISKVQGEDIVPDKVLIVEREDSYAIYENRFLYTLVQRMQAFLRERCDAVAELNGAHAFSYAVCRTAVWNRRHLEASLQLNFEQRPEGSRGSSDAAEMTPMERVNQLRARVDQLTRAPLMRQLKGVTPVAPPIVRTNVFKKNENFKRALELYEYLEGYRKPGYEIVTDAPDARPLPPEMRKDLCELIALEGFVGQIGASAELRGALEENFLRENEAAEQERIRREEERERQVRARIAEARAEEIAIREAEVARREAVIAERNGRISALEGELDAARRSAEAERERHAREAEAMRAQARSELEAAQERGREELARAQEQFRRESLQEKERHAAELRRGEAALAERERAHAGEMEALRRAAEDECNAAVRAERERAAREMDDREKAWRSAQDAQRRELQRRGEAALQLQQKESAVRAAGLERQLRRTENKLRGCERRLEQLRARSAAKQKNWRSLFRRGDAPEER